MRTLNYTTTYSVFAYTYKLVVVTAISGKRIPILQPKSAVPFTVPSTYKYLLINTLKFRQVLGATVKNIAYRSISDQVCILITVVVGI